MSETAQTLRVVGGSELSKAEQYGKWFGEMLQGVEKGTAVVDFGKIQQIVSEVRGMGPGPSLEQEASPPRTMRVPAGQVGREPGTTARPPAPATPQLTPDMMMRALGQAGGDTQKAEAMLAKMMGAQAKQAGAGAGPKGKAKAPAGVRKTLPAASNEPTAAQLEAPVYEASGEISEALHGILTDRFGPYMEAGLKISLITEWAEGVVHVQILLRDPRQPNSPVILANLPNVFTEDWGKGLRRVIQKAHRNIIEIYGPPKEALVDAPEDDEEDYDLDEEEDEGDDDLEDDYED